MLSNAVAVTAGARDEAVRLRLLDGNHVGAGGEGEAGGVGREDGGAHEDGDAGEHEDGGDCCRAAREGAEAGRWVVAVAVKVLVRAGPGRALAPPGPEGEEGAEADEG